MDKNLQVVGKLTLRQIRVLKGMSQSEFAKYLGIPYGSYRRYEKDTATMDAGQLFRICDTLGVDVSCIRLQ